MPCSAGNERSRRSAGVALVSVLWLLVLLSMLVLNLSTGSRTELRLAGNLRQAAAARHVAEAGINWGAWSLMQANTAGWLADGSTRTLELDGIAVEVALFDEQGKIDLNEAETPLLQGLFESVGEDRKVAEALAAAIVDWRDDDGVRTPLGAEEEEYEAAGLIGPGNSPFEEVKELRKVLGMSEELYRKVRPALTIDSNKAEINPLVAPREVLLALPGVDPGGIERFIEERRRNYESGERPPMLGGVDSRFLSPNAPGVNYSIVTRTTVSPTVQIRQQLLVHLRGGGQGLEVLDSSAPE
ncbi:type II secretion system minor pseudopilin [Pseudomonas oryzae]|uniref:Type II secretion system protein K (GspK) n=1 Tax=Pseudomonas oryzae TaxID=1392877 RepID=A0A1H1RW06_9PSED|nr:PilX N-terminal domain-containing pilus assembly protein [Pseudomonas oryzae]SDS39746.1 type II secretion system protein K (GspK) [Pseudomonas oryzae]